mgnify:CR=1 FL=1
MGKQKKKQKKRGNPLWTLVFLAALAVFCFSGYKLIGIYLDYKTGTDEYRDLQQYTTEITKTPETPAPKKTEEPQAESEPAEPSEPEPEPLSYPTEPPLAVDFESLKAINLDVKGWLYIEALDISYPVVQGPDNDAYLHTTYEGTSNFAGSIFLDYQNQDDFSDGNTIVYGHNMKNLSMFGKLKQMKEQEKYRDWLKSQPPEEILHHTYEYTVREDIVMAMEELELTDAQAQALLESPSPLADVYRYFEKLETGYMDMIRDSIENRADDVCRAKEELRTTPIYPHSAAYASEHGEMAQYNLSYQANSACKEAIEQTISAHYAENRLDTEAAVKDVLEKFGTERVQFILANTIQRKNYDGRISQDNKAWAKTIPMLEDSGASRHSAYLVVDQVNPGLTDLFTRQFRKVAQEQQKSSVLQKLQQEPPARKPAAPKKREPER